MARTTRTLRVELPEAVWSRLNDEAADKGLSLGTHARRLIVARDKRKFPETGSRTEGSDASPTGATDSTGPTEKGK
jgi:hypothetical protein